MPAPRLPVARPLGLAFVTQSIRNQALGRSQSKLPLRFYAQLSSRRVALRGLSAINAHHVRFKSNAGKPSQKKSSPNNKKGDANQEPNEKPPRPPISKIFLSLFIDTIRSLTGVFRSKNLKNAWQTHPGEVLIAAVTLTGVAGCAGYVVYLYFNYFYSEQFTRFPDPVAASLRRALYYSDHSPNTELAIKYYQKAIHQCVEFGLDFFSDEFVGIRLRVAQWLEKTGAYDDAIFALETILKDHKRWVEVMEKEVKEGKISEATRLSLLRPTRPAGVETEEALPATAWRPEGQAEETIWGKRNRILRKAIAVSLKLAELYSDEHVLKEELAHERLVWAAEAMLKEMQRRSVEGTKEGELFFMNDEEVGGVFEQLGQSFLSQNKAHLAVPLFFQALSLCKLPCHSAVIMNNLATSFAQHPINGDNIPPSPENDPKKAAEVWKATRETYLDSARNWATNAIKLATETKGEETRTPECDHACAVALCNLGDIANLRGDVEEARKRFEQAVATSTTIGFSEGVQQAKAGLKTLDEAERKKKSEAQSK